MSNKICMVHGRFQPFTLHHMHYVKKALNAHSESDLIIAITNPTLQTSGLSEGDDHRHLRKSNPYTFEQRKSMIEASLILDKDIDKRNRIYIIPFPINTIIDKIKNSDSISEKEAKQIIEEQTINIMQSFNYANNVIQEISLMLNSHNLLQYMIISDGWGLEKRRMFEAAGYDIETIEYPRITSGTAVRYLQSINDQSWKNLVPIGTQKVIEYIEKNPQKAQAIEEYSIE